MEAAMEKKNMEIQAINHQTIGQRLKSYKRSPLSLVLLLLVSVSALLTVLTLLFLIAYILIKGIPYLTPSLFAWEYTTENVSLMPAHGSHDRAFPADRSSSRYFRSHLSGRICEARKPAGEHRADYR